MAENIIAPSNRAKRLARLWDTVKNAVAGNSESQSGVCDQRERRQYSAKHRAAYDTSRFVRENEQSKWFEAGSCANEDDPLSPCAMKGASVRRIEPNEHR